MCLPVIWDAEACGTEVRRNAERGVHALTFTENPAAMGYPSFHDDYWTPLWEASGGYRHGDECAHRVLGPVGDHRPGCPDGCDDHACSR